MLLPARLKAVPNEEDRRAPISTGRLIEVGRQRKSEALSSILCEPHLLNLITP
jgi:hypothetical protein